MKWKKVFFCIFTLTIVLISCQSDKTTVEKVIEDGVEVVVNHLEPYQIKGEPTNLSLAHAFTLDMEDPSILNLGLTDIWIFDVDSQGNIFIFQSPNKDDALVFKFDPNGDFLMSFGHMGEGPQEIQSPVYLGINSRDEIVIIDRAKKKLVFFNNTGERLKEIPFDLRYRPQRGFQLLNNSSYLIHYFPVGPNGEVDLIFLNIYDSKFNKINTLDKYHGLANENEKVNAFGDFVPVVGISKTSIYTGYGKKNGDINVYDLNGELKRKIRKEYKPVPVPPKLEQELEERFKTNQFLAEHVYIPKYMPLFQYFFTDDEERLYVVTSEKDKETGSNICDIYNSEGIFIEQKVMGYFDLIKYFYIWEPFDVTAKNSRLYCIREKESGFKELLVYEMRWE